MIPNNTINQSASADFRISTSNSFEGEGEPAVTTKLPYPREELHRQGPQRSFSGRALGEIAFPLGGIGTGTVSLGGRGQLRDWEIFNRPGKGVTLPYTFFSIWAQAKGGQPITRVLESRLQPPYTRADGLASSEQAGLPRLDSCTFHGEYP